MSLGVFIYTRYDMSMLRSRIFLTACFLTVVVGCLDIIGLKLYLFWTVWWFDMVMHFLGGATVALFGTYYVEQHRNPSYANFLVVGLFTSIIFGVFWELYELAFHITDIHTADYIADTGMDMIMDTTGGFVAVLYSYIITRHD